MNNKEITQCEVINFSSPSDIKLFCHDGQAFKVKFNFQQSCFDKEKKKPGKLSKEVEILLGIVLDKRNLQALKHYQKLVMDRWLVGVHYDSWPLCNQVAVLKDGEEFLAQELQVTLNIGNMPNSPDPVPEMTFQREMTDEVPLLGTPRIGYCYPMTPVIMKNLSRSVHQVTPDSCMRHRLRTIRGADFRHHMKRSRIERPRVQVVQNRSFVRRMLTAMRRMMFWKKQPEE